MEDLVTWLRRNDGWTTSSSGARGRVTVSSSCPHCVRHKYTFLIFSIIILQLYNYDSYINFHR